MQIVSRIGIAAGALAAIAILAAFAPAKGQLRVYNIAQTTAAVSVNGGPESVLGNSEFSNQVVSVGRTLISVRRRGTIKGSVSLTTENAYHSPNSGDHWCVRVGNTAIDLLPVANCEQLVDFGG
jgi:hypothetical protein